jgi:uncharacterized membrane protein YqhA
MRAQRSSASHHLQDGFERGLAASRIIMIVPVVVLLVTAVAAFGYGTDVFVISIAASSRNRCPYGTISGYS